MENDEEKDVAEVVEGGNGEAEDVDEENGEVKVGEMSEMKIVIYLKGDRATIGIMKSDCDPVFRTMEGGTVAIGAQLEALVADAKTIWDTKPRYPRCETKLPSQETPPIRTTPAQQTTTSNKAQHSLF